MSDPLFFNAQPLRYLDEERLQQIHQATLGLMQDFGCRILHNGARDLLAAKGAAVRDDGQVQIPAAMVEWAIRQAPEQITIYDRNGQPAMALQERNVYFGTGSDCNYLLDPETDRPREFRFSDVIDGIRLADSLPHIDFIMSMGLAAELNERTAFQEKFAAMVQYSTKPQVVISGPDIGVLEDIIDMAAVLAGDRDHLSRKPTFLLLANPTSPLVHSAEAMDQILVMAANRLPVIYTPGLMAGATCPVTIAGAIVQANAEILCGLVIHQLTAPGAPFIFGAGMSPLDMKSGQPTYAAPEAVMAQAGICQLGRELYKLPTWGFGGCSASKLCDEQAVNEATAYLQASAWMGTSLVHDVGYLESGLTYSFEYLVLCNEFIGQIRRMMTGIVVDPEHLALDAIRRVGPGGTYLTDPHTMTHFRCNWVPDLTDRRTRKMWEKQGEQSMGRKAIKRVRHILADWQPQMLAPELLAKLRAVCDLH
ncbi:MAG: trimethylamine methyltransferase family protein [bacterium]